MTSEPDAGQLATKAKTATARASGGTRGPVDKHELRLPGGGFLRYYPEHQSLHAVCDNPCHYD